MDTKCVLETVDTWNLFYVTFATLNFESITFLKVETWPQACQLKPLHDAPRDILC